MKTSRFLQALIFLFCVAAFTQANAQIDTVCAGTQNKSYWVQGSAGSTFSWMINGGTQASGTNTDSITIDWSLTPGSDTLKVVEISSDGCIGDTMFIVVVRMELPTALVSGSNQVCDSQDSTIVSIDLTGSYPWDFSYTDGTNTINLTNITTTPYTFSTGLLTTTTTYTVSAITDRLGCIGTASGSAIVSVGPRPNTSGIFY